jgi:cold shock CspA family protein
LLRDLEHHYPEHTEIRQELIWALYDSRLRPAKEAGNSQAVLEAAREIVAAEATGPALRLTVFTVMGVAKTKGQWRLLSNWCDLLDPCQLTAESKPSHNGNMPSDRERWYFAKLKALLHMAEWHLAAELAEHACSEFPHNPDFRRWQANSWAGLGRVREALDLLDSLRPRIAWYALADMARYSFELEDVEGAWTLGEEAAAAVGQDSAKVNLWELMSKTALALGRAEVALVHAGLMAAVRREQDWPLRPSQQELLLRVLEEAGTPDLPVRSSRDWKSLCRAHWGGRREVGVPGAFQRVSTERQQGQVVSFEPTRTFAFILRKGGSEQIFVLLQDLPCESRRNGARVTFETIKHFDKRKNKESARAVRVEPFRKQEG